MQERNIDRGNKFTSDSHYRARHIRCRADERVNRFINSQRYPLLYPRCIILQKTYKLYFDTFIDPLGINIVIWRWKGGYLYAEGIFGKNYGYNEPIFINEIRLDGLNDNALRQYFKRMLGSGDLARFDTGIYYLPKASRLLKKVI